MIRNIIFDLGGVILNIDYHLSINCFKLLGIKNFDTFFTQASQNKLFDMFDKGEISDAEFRKKIRELTGHNLSDLKIDHAWNSMLLDLPKERLDLLSRAKDHYRIFLLSNTNSIHYPQYMDYLKRIYGLNSLSDVFEKEYLSHEIGKRKPDVEAFMHIIEDKKLNPGETFFIDDSEQHIFGAKKAGLHSYWLDISKESIIDLFEKNGVLKSGLVN